MFNILLPTSVLDMDVNNVTSFVYGELLGQDIPYPLPKPHACIDCNLNCPLQKGQTYSYINTLPVKKEYPDVSIIHVHLNLF